MKCCGVEWLSTTTFGSPKYKNAFMLLLRKYLCSPVAFTILIATLTGCQTDTTGHQANHSITVYAAPDPVPLAQANYTSFKQKLAARKTINVFRAWNAHLYGNGYELYWAARPIGHPERFALMEVYWNYHYVGKPWSTYPGQEPFITNNKWNHDEEYGKTVWLNYFDPQFPKYFANLVHDRSKSFGADGIILDW